MEQDVVVAGMGPVGLVAALALAQEGVRVTVLEAGAELSTESRASTFHPPSLEYLERLGVVDELQTTGLQASTFQQRDRRGGILLELDLGLLAGDTRYPYRLQSEQDNLTRIIYRRLQSFDNVKLLFSSPLRAVIQQEDAVEVHIQGRDAPLRVAWLVGADGASSAVRSSLDISFEGITYPERFFVISTDYDFRLAFPDLALVSYISDPEEWLVLLRTPRHWRVLFPIQPFEREKDINDQGAIQDRLQRVHPLHGGYPVAHTTLYHVHQRMVTRMAQGRVLLAGDAAHINNPLGGLGMNSGIHDAVAAAKTILCSLRGGDVGACSSAYDQVRRATVKEYVLSDTAQNFADLSDTEESRRKRRADEFARLSADRSAQRAQMMRTSMLTSARESEAALAERLEQIK